MINISNWQVGSEYKNEDVVYYDSEFFSCIVDHKATSDLYPCIDTINLWHVVTGPQYTKPSPTIQSLPVSTPVQSITTEEPVNKLVISLNTLLGGAPPCGTYFQSWSSAWSSNATTLDLALIDKSVNIVYLSFVNPNTQYTKGQNTFKNTGLDFSSDFGVVRDSITSLKARGVVVMLSVGGDSYSFTDFNPSGVAALAHDLGCNGVDINWENQETKDKFGGYIKNLRYAIGSDAAISIAGFSVGAYGEGNWIYSKPVSPNTGMCIAGLKSNVSTIDWINVMSYDAGNDYSPTEAFDAYRSYYNGPILMGFKVPPEDSEGHATKLDEIEKVSKYILGKNAGIFTWSYQKQGIPSSTDILSHGVHILASVPSGDITTDITPSVPVVPPVVPVVPVTESVEPVVPVIEPVVIGLPKTISTDIVSNWSGEGIQYKTGIEVSYNGSVYKCKQEHASQTDLTPLTTSLWSLESAAPVNELPPVVTPPVVTPSVPSAPVVPVPSSTVPRAPIAADVTILAPYLYNWGFGNKIYKINKCVDIQNVLGGNVVTIAFVTGNDITSITDDYDDIKEFVQNGGQLIVSFGGANGVYFEDSVDSATAIEKISYLISDIGVGGIDWDIEGSYIFNYTLHNKRSKIIAAVQAKYPGLYVSFTLPSNINGLTQDGINIIHNAIQNGVTINTINGMVMDMGNELPIGHSYGLICKIAGEMIVEQIQTIYGDKSKADAYRMLGLIPMIGKDNYGVYFQPSDADFVSHYAKTNNIGLIGLWAINRDQVAPNGSNEYAIYSLANETDYQYYDTFKNNLGVLGSLPVYK
jgi:chitinase